MVATHNRQNRYTKRAETAHRQGEKTRLTLYEEKATFGSVCRKLT